MAESETTSPSPEHRETDGVDGGAADRDATVLAFPSLGRRRADRERRPAPVGADTPRLREVVGDVLRDERRRQDRTLADVAERAAVSLPYLSEVERGVKDVSSDVLAAICDALELPLADVLERSARHLRAGAGSGFTMLAA